MVKYLRNFNCLTVVNIIVHYPACFYQFISVIEIPNFLYTSLLTFLQIIYLLVNPSKESNDAVRLTVYHLKSEVFITLYCYYTINPLHSSMNKELFE